MRAIVAMAPNRVIGYKGGIPWHYKEDLKWFKKFTMGKTLVMGWNTYNSLPVKLEGRKICVITKSWTPSLILQSTKFKADKVYFRFPPGYKNLKDATFNPKEFSDSIVAGGAKTYALLMPYIEDMFVTHIADEYPGDSYMPEFESQFNYQEIVEETKDFTIVRYML